MLLKKSRAKHIFIPLSLIVSILNTLKVHYHLFHVGCLYVLFEYVRRSENEVAQKLAQVTHSI